MKLKHVNITFEDESREYNNSMTVSCTREHDGKWRVQVSAQQGYFTVEPEALDGLVEQFSGIANFMRIIQRTLDDATSEE